MSNSTSDPIDQILMQLDILKEKYESKIDKHAQVDIQRIEMAALRLKEAISS